MPSTYTPDLRLELQANGENSSTWGTKLNSSIQQIEDAIAGMIAVATTGGNTTLTTVNGGTDQSRYAMLKITGTLVSNSNIIVPDASKEYLIWNATSGAYTVTVKTAAGSGVVVTQGATAHVFCDATNVLLAAGGSAQAEVFTNKTLTSPAINGTVTTTGLTLPAFTLGGTVTSNGRSFSGTIANLGTVTTVDINGGTIDGTTQASGTINGPIAVGGTWTAAATWTLPALTLGGNVSSTGNPSLSIGTGTLTAGSGTFSGGIISNVAGRGLYVNASTDSSVYTQLQSNGGTTLMAVARAEGGGWYSNLTGFDSAIVYGAAKGLSIGGFGEAQVARFSSTGLAVTGVVTPEADNTRTLGTGPLRWSVVYAGTGTINTSDAREKTEVRPLTEAEISASKQLSKEIGAYRWLSAVEQKGDTAREHIGLTVQRAIEIMESNGLNPMTYGFICYDSWEDNFVEHPAVEAKEATYDEEGNELTPAIEAKDVWAEQTQVAGDRYSFRMDELNLFLARGFEARLAALEAK